MQETCNPSMSCEAYWTSAANLFLHRINQLPKTVFKLLALFSSYRNRKYLTIRHTFIEAWLRIGTTAFVRGKSRTQTSNVA